MKLKYYLFLLFIVFTHNKTFAQLPIDSMIGSWKIDSILVIAEQETQDKAVKKRVDKMMNKMLNAIVSIKKNKGFSFISNLTVMNVKKGKWRLNTKTNYVEIADATTKDYSLMALRIFKKEEEYYLEIEEALIAKIHRINNGK